MKAAASRIFPALGTGLSMVLLGSGPVWAGMPVPAPLVGVTGPVGIVAASVIYGGYLLYRRSRKGS
jgi:hypothetical protein